ncbi:MAG: VOC family protein [Alphaproteobacteria bacterium]
MAHPVIRFEIGCSDSKKTRGFYGETFGWTFTENGPLSANITSGAEGGPDGAITSLGHEPHQYMMIYIRVEDVRTAIKDIKANGGDIQVGPLPTPDGREFAWAKDPEGNLFGILSEAAPKP